MECRALGKTGLKTSVIGLGCSRLGASVFEDHKTNPQSFLHFALEQGVNFFDTADSYGYGNSERLLGQAFRGKRDKVIIATKGGFLPSSLARFGKYVLPVIGPFRSLISKQKTSLKKISTKRQRFDVSYLKKALENSLRRLETDYIDLYQLHSPPRTILEREEIFHFLARCQQEGKIRFYGISVNTIQDGVFCLQIPNIAALQVPINILEQQATTDLLPQAFSKTGILARVPFARGLLTNTRSVTTGNQLGTPSSSYHKLKRLYEMCRQEDRTLSDVALQFLLQQQSLSSILVGTKSIQHLKANILASNQPALSQDLISHISSLKESIAKTKK